ncbi:MAG: NADP-dependent oxidoreductase [Pseudomonadales bacterium]
MSETSNRGWKLARTPAAGWPAAADYQWFEQPVPEPAAGQMLTRTLYLSLDPYQWVRRRSGTEQPGDVCHGRTVSQVIDSRLEGYQPGDFVFNTNGWQTHGLTGKDISTFGYMLPRKIDPALAPISTALGIMGMLGLTAYAGLMVQCEPQAGETVVVSAASGGVGQCVGQMAKLRGCRVVGIAGASHKCDYVTQTLGFDACVSHLSPSLAQDLRAACPGGIDVYFENVGGAVFEAVLPLFNSNARASLCGLISQYGNTDGGNMLDQWFESGKTIFAARSVTAHKLFVGDFVDAHQSQFLETMGEWLREGRVQYREHVTEGIERAPDAYANMLSGANFGKSLVAVSPDST